MAIQSSESAQVLEAVWQALGQEQPPYGELRNKQSRYFWVTVPGWQLKGAQIHYEFISRRGAFSAEFHVESRKVLNGRVEQLAQTLGEVDGLPVKFSGTWGSGCMLGVSFASDTTVDQMAGAMRQLIEKTYPHINAWFESGLAESELAVDKQLTDGEGDAMALNQILYGPPGTGKTYATIYAALQILDPEAAASYKQIDEDDEATLDERLAARKALKARFDELAAEQRVRFVTFHQSFSYEDFVEGLRAETDETSGQLRYDVSDGVFKSLCRDARSKAELVSVFDQAIERLQEKLDASNGRLSLKTVRGKAFEVAYEGGKTFRVFPSSTEVDDPYYVASMDNVRKLFAGDAKKGMYNPSYVEGMLRYLQAECGLPAKPEGAESSAEVKPYVLIIDEINRGNISRIFGELITLIEPSKRAGADEALSVTLPYSKETFSVPDNVYIIGTMNTADRSLAGLDLALRRRFSFTEMPPRPELLDEVEVEGINVGQMLRVMNQRITVLLDRDHTIGHAYFMPLQTEPTLTRLAAIFRQAILPLLQEYFFEDWERIRWVLNDHRKDSVAFIVEDKSLALQALFGDVHSKLRQAPQWVLNEQAFRSIAAFAGIAANSKEIAPEQAATGGADV